LASATASDTASSDTAPSDSHASDVEVASTGAASKGRLASNAAASKGGLASIIAFAAPSSPDVGTPALSTMPSQPPASSRSRRIPFSRRMARVRTGRPMRMPHAAKANHSTLALDETSD